MKVRDVMTAPAITIGPDASYRDIIHCLLANDISGLPVVDAQGRILGVVTESDLVAEETYGLKCRALGILGEFIQGRQPSGVSKYATHVARELMTPEPIVAGLDDDLSVAASRMLDHHCNRLPVVSDGCVVGIVSRQDLLRHFDRADREITLDIAETLAGIPAGDAPDQTDVTYAVHNGTVTLVGEVASAERAGVVRDAVLQVGGVTALDDRMRYNRP